MLLLSEEVNRLYHNVTAGGAASSIRCGGNATHFQNN